MSCGLIDEGAKVQGLPHLSVLLVVVLAVLAGCGRPIPHQLAPRLKSNAVNLSPHSTAPEARVTYIATWDGRPNGPRWTKTTVEALEAEPHLLADTPRDIAEFCPNFAKLDRSGRLQFWLFFISAIAQRETEDLNERDQCWEHPCKIDGIHCKSPSTNSTARECKPYLSIGLMSMSLSDARRAYNYPAAGPPRCPYVTSEADLYDGVKNLKCAVTVMSILEHKRLEIGGSAVERERGFHGLATAWSTIRDPDPGHFSNRSYIIGEIRKHPQLMCWPPG